MEVAQPKEATPQLEVPAQLTEGTHQVVVPAVVKEAILQQLVEVVKEVTTTFRMEKENNLVLIFSKDAAI